MKSLKWIASTIMIISVFIMTYSCDKQSNEWKGTFEEVDGVTVIRNPKEPRYTADVLNLKEDLVLGREEKEAGLRSCY